MRTRHRHERHVLEVERRCLSCGSTELMRELEHAGDLGTPCSRCHAPTERIAVRGRHTEHVPRNPHAAALGRLGGLKGGPARAAALSAKRRRAIARTAARARWNRKKG